MGNERYGVGKGLMLLASDGLRPGMLLNLLHCLGKHSTTKNYVAQNVNSAKVEKSWSN